MTVCSTYVVPGCHGLMQALTGAALGAMLNAQGLPQVLQVWSIPNVHGRL